jgi:hypothetical protein
MQCPGTKAKHTLTFEQFAKQADLKRYDKGSLPFREGIQRICSTYNTAQLTNEDYRFLIPVIYAPNSFFQRKLGTKAMSSSQWCKLGMEVAEIHIKQRVEQKTNI